MRNLALLCTALLAALSLARATEPEPARVAKPEARAQVQAEIAAGVYRQPALRGETVFFVAEGDLWRVGIAGGRAERVTTHADQERSPAVSPDGRWLAFSGGYAGVLEAYIMPAAGGTPRRLSWSAQPAGAVFSGQGYEIQGFTAAGEVLATSGTEAGRRGTQLYAIDPASGARRTLPVADASDGALSADGRTLYFTRGALHRGDNVRRYPGGAMSRLWVLDLASQHEAQPLVKMPANARRPMPYTSQGRARVAFLSDRDGWFNVWSVDARGGELRQHTRHRQWDVRSASIDGARVIYALGADLHLVDLDSGAQRTLPITLGSDFAQRQTRWVAPAPFVTSLRLSADGERVAVTARGRIAIQGTGSVRRVELPIAPGAACRAGTFSHDSRHVFALCDMSGELEVWRFAADGSAPPTRLTHDGRTRRRGLFPSPNGQWLAHTDNQGSLWLTPLHGDGAGPTQLLEGRFQELWFQRQVWWSPDGRFLAFDALDAKTRRVGLVLHEPAGNGAGKTTVLGSDRYNNHAPAFSLDGRWLYFASERTFDSTLPGPWGDRNFGPSFERRGRIYAVALQPGARFPFKPRDELQAAAGSASAARSTLPAPEAMQHVVPGLTGDLAELRTDGKRLFFLDADPVTRKRALKSLPIDDSGTVAETLVADVASYDLTPDGRRMMVVRAPAEGAGGALSPRAGEVLLLDTAARLPTDTARAQVRWADWRIPVDPPAEWRQLFHDAWALQRDTLWDRSMLGVDWEAQRRQFAALLPRVTDRHDLTELLAQMVAALGTLHSRVQAPDTRLQLPDAAPAMLGARLSRLPQGWRVERVFSGDPELPEQLSPLAAAGVLEGEIISAVNGRPAQELPAIEAALQGQVGRQVMLNVSASDGTHRKVVVLPISASREADLRTSDWEWGLARRTLERTQGRVGYLRLRAMGTADIGTFAREFYSHFWRDGLIIDARGNWGGNIDEWVLEKLMKRAWMHWQPRSGDLADAHPNMRQSFNGHLVVLIDEHTYSDGEAFAEGVRRLGLGTLIGTRTAGAGVWLADTNPLLDNGLMRAAEYAPFSPDGQWLVERVGVAPDIEVDNLPRASAAGDDAQLDAAISHLQELIRRRPMKAPVLPKYPTQ